MLCGYLRLKLKALLWLASIVSQVTASASLVITEGLTD